jgi:hypothetical protein
LNSGDDWSRLSCENCRGTEFGSKLGSDTITRTAPLSGSSATIEPRRPASPWIAARCAAGSSVVWTSSPSLTPPPSSSISERNSSYSPVSSPL